MAPQLFEEQPLERRRSESFLQRLADAQGIKVGVCMHKGWLADQGRGLHTQGVAVGRPVKAALAPEPCNSWFPFPCLLLSRRLPQISPDL